MKRIAIYLFLLLSVGLPALYGQETNGPVNLSVDVLAMKEDKLVFGKPICNLPGRQKILQPVKHLMPVSEFGFRPVLVK